MIDRGERERKEREEGEKEKYKEDRNCVMRHLEDGGARGWGEETED